MSVKHALMALLFKKPMHGYELRAAFDDMVYALWPLNPGQVYSTLDRLARDEKVTFERIEQDDRPDRKVYTLTERGREEFLEWVKKSEIPDNLLRRDFYFKLICMQTAGVEGTKEVISKERKRLYKATRELDDFASKLDPEKDRLMLFLVEGGFLELEAQLKWLDICEIHLASGARTQSGAQSQKEGRIVRKPENRKALEQEKPGG
jgi:DNA-binding PadR family transcriptional regulator